ncbi:hypothetical protein BED35_15905 [Yersinia enterocolitica]|uniref:Uncharacterized protein n=1 Tax=Yersinia enterocolitica TaxID=630 RepID=A0ABM9RYU3_YEREN|nr:hypothetical protein BB936_15785 [Yersinia enterocolitica]AOF19790.1 hypothetical protein BED34_15435 [Yersinia enterocolitica]AOF24327.1 hypothetical protein BED33_18130 [Yersinia enterocolitica]AOF27967.1 hypothetical protein BED32_15045 [Yersinia enterocolitica]AOF32143.1 hypothetical protein BED35_15905 [Yersinia enterocolitica]
MTNNSINADLTISFTVISVNKIGSDIYGYITEKSIYALGSMPRRFNSCRASSLNQLANVVWSFFASKSSCSRSSGLILIWNVGDLPPVLGVRSFVLDIVRTFVFNASYKVRILYDIEVRNQAVLNRTRNTV